MVYDTRCEPAQRLSLPPGKRREGVIRPAALGRLGACWLPQAFELPAGPNLCEAPAKFLNIPFYRRGCGRALGNLAYLVSNRPRLGFSVNTPREAALSYHRVQVSKSGICSKFLNPQIAPSGRGGCALACFPAREARSETPPTKSYSSLAGSPSQIRSVVSMHFSSKKGVILMSESSALIILPRPLSSRRLAVLPLAGTGGKLTASPLPRRTSPHMVKSLEATGPPRIEKPAVAARRCAVKGCVFPATIEAYRQCSYHRLQVQEPTLFESLQPSVLVLGQALYGLPDSEPDDSRQRDRRRQFHERQAFLLDEAA
jgi:hypothetical protein